MTREREKEMENKVKPAEVCERTREVASVACLFALREVWEKDFSEEEFINLWLEKLRRNENLFPSGWYTSLPPKGPPYGTAALFGDDDNPDRLNYGSLRPQENHPQNNIYFDPETGIAYIYASPVDRTTGIIGDWGMTFYAGNNPEIIAHLKYVYTINHQIAQIINPGM